MSARAYSAAPPLREKVVSAMMEAPGERFEGEEEEGEVGVETTVPQMSWAGIGRARERVSVQVSSSDVMAQACTRIRYWVAEGVGKGVVVWRCRVVGWSWWCRCRARIFFFFFDF